MSFEYVSPQGIIVPDTQTIQDEITVEYKDVFGQDLVTTPDSPAGLLITTDTISRTSSLNLSAQVANQINPNIAEGVFLDAIAGLTGLQRTKATPTTVTATITGVPDTLIPSGSRALSGENEFQTIAQVTIPTSGTLEVEFQSVVLGAIPCPTNSLNVIFDVTLGWETVNNAQAGVIGLDTQSDLSFRKLRRSTLALQGVALPFAIKSNIQDINDVKSCTFLENETSETVVKETIEMIPHSIYLCVDGGTDEEIAYTLYGSKTLGAGYNGNQEVTITPPDSDAPYTVKFDRPELIDIYINITVKVTNGGSSNTVDEVKQAILNYANGLAEENGFVVGNDVSSFELSASVSSQTSLFVTNVETSLDNVTFSVDTKTIEINQKAQTFNSFIKVEVM